MTPNWRERMAGDPAEAGMTTTLRRVILMRLGNLSEGSFEVRDSRARLGSQLGGGSRNRGLSGALDPRNTAIESSNQFVQVAERPFGSRALRRLLRCPLGHLRNNRNYPRASRMPAGAVRAGECHIRRTMSGGSTPDPTSRIQLLAELTSDIAMTLQISAHAMTTAVFMSSRVMFLL